MARKNRRATASSATLTDGAGRPCTLRQAETWLLAGKIRNELERFHADGSPGHFISDDQMKSLNIVIRHAIHEELETIRLIRHGLASYPDTTPEEQRALEPFLGALWCVSPDYMEPPGSPELDSAYQAVIEARPCWADPDDES